jgi:hypothetical protein
LDNQYNKAEEISINYWIINTAFVTSTKIISSLSFCGRKVYSKVVYSKQVMVAGSVLPDGWV